MNWVTLSILGYYVIQHRYSNVSTSTPLVVQHNGSSTSKPSSHRHYTLIAITSVRKTKILSATSSVTALSYLQRRTACFYLLLTFTTAYSLTDAPQQRQRQQRRPIEEDAFASSGESSDAYVQERQLKPKRRVKDEPRRATRKRKRKQQLTEEDLNDLPPEKGSSFRSKKLAEKLTNVCPANKLRLDMQFDAILKPKKANRQKKRKKDDEEILDRFADEEVSRLREAMLGAAADDEQANRDKLPATNKLKLLPQVMEVLRKYAVAF